jgi:hypothetical protein
MGRMNLLTMSTLVKTSATPSFLSIYLKYYCISMPKAVTAILTKFAKVFEENERR